MRPLMALELIWTGESFATEGPAADEGSFSCVPTEVGPQVGCLAVDLSTARDVTYVLLLFSWVTAWCKKHKSELESYWVVWRDWVFFLNKTFAGLTVVFIALKNAWIGRPSLTVLSSCKSTLFFSKAYILHVGQLIVQCLPRVCIGH